jgi:formyltetrahydrofolate-dependent phosphoribosylglycinamide formyltransferase
LLSGSGTTLQNLIDRIGDGSLDAQIQCVIASREGVYGLERAKNYDIPAITVARKGFADTAEFNAELWKAIREFDVDLVVMAGFMSLIEVPDDFVNRIINVHPALIPAFCGQGMYGHHVHEAVLEYGAKLTGVTVHYADAEYDHGPIIMQASVPVEDDDTPDTLADRVQAKERELYPQAIQLIAEGRVQVVDRRVSIA